jgi:hypothetical protein
MSNLTTLRISLNCVGYTPELLEDGDIDEAGGRAPWCTGYGRLPQTARNACVTVVDTQSRDTVERVLKLTGAPLALVPNGAHVTIWKKCVAGVDQLEVLPVQALVDLTDRARELLDPLTIHRAKTLGRFDTTYQLSFIDVGLLPQIEQMQGEDLQRLLERIVAELREPTDTLTPEEGHQILTIAFWILAARMLRDHGVPGFVNLEAEGRCILKAVAQHYGGAVPILAKKLRTRVDAATAVAWTFGADLGKIGPEAIAYVYESSLIAKQTRRDLGTHSTPPYLVEYVLGRLRKAICSISADRRIVVEPACGHGAFLVGALRVLAEEGPADAGSRHDYLRAHLRGLELDHAAKELARVSLTVADVPNSDGWDLREGDMFEEGALTSLAQGATILLANPPFEANKSAEMLRQVIPVLEQDAVMGVVVPRQLLSSRSEHTLRRALLEKFQLIEICLLPDRVFRFSDHECALILARGEVGGTKRNAPITFRRVREAGLDGFRECARVSTEEVVPGSIFLDSPTTDLVLPELRRIWNARCWSTLSDIALVQQGMSYHGWVRQSGYETVRDHAFEGSARGIAASHKSTNALITDDPPYNYLDVTPRHIRDSRAGLPTGKPQVVLNHHPHGRGPWRIMAFIDPQGAAIPSTRIAVRPRESSICIEVLWAICNSIVANAFVYTHLGKRHITTGPLSTLPIPAISDDLNDDLVGLVRAFFAETRRPDRDEKRFREILERIDAVLLGAYGLFADAEQQILSLFEGHTRPGLPYQITSVGSSSRLPQYLGVPNLVPVLPPPTALGQFSLISDIDAEIDAGYRELAALRRAADSGDPRVTRRMQYVRDTVSALQQNAAKLWIPEKPAAY